MAESVKVAFIGPHGVGKTTLCFDLASRLKRLDLGVDIVKEVARACPLPINEETTIDAQAWILHTQIGQEIAAASQYEAVICDRSVLDNYAYLVHAAGRQRRFDALVRQWVTTYTALFKVPIIEPPSFDGTRALSTTFQAEINAIIDDLLGAFGVPCYRLDAEDRAGWIDAVMEVMRMQLEPPQIDLFATS